MRASNSTTSTALGAGAVGEPGQRAFYIQARTESAQLTVLVEKEQVALLAAEAVAFLDRIADEYPEDADRAAATRSAELREPTVPLFRARMIGLGFDPERELVLIELREHSTDPRTTTTRATTPSRERRRSTTEASGLRRPDLRDPSAGAGDGGARRGGGGGGPAAVRAVLAADGPGRAPVPPLELTAAPIWPRCSRRGQVEVVGRLRYSSNGAFFVGRAPTASRSPPSTSRGAASGRCGTSPTARCAGARSPRASSPTASVGTSCPSPCCATTARSARARCSASSSTTPRSTTSRCSTDHEDRFRQFAVFDILANNTDRKGGHCLHDMANDVDRRHRPRAHVPSVVEAAHGDLGLRRRAGARCARSTTCAGVVTELDDGDARRAARRLLSPAELAAVAIARRRAPPRRPLPAPDPGYHSVPWPHGR